MWITFWVIVRTNQIFVYIILFWNKQELMNIPKVTIHNEVFTFGSTSSCQTSDSWHKQKSCWLSQNNTLLYTSWEIMRWLLRMRMNWIISVLSRRYFVFLFIWNLKYWDNNNVSYIKIDLFFRYPQLVLSSLPTDLVNAKYIHILLKIFSDRKIFP